MRVERFTSGQVVFREGDGTRDVYRVVSGRVEISIGAGPQRASLALLGSGEIFGEMAMIEDKDRSATATALEATEVERLSPAEFNRVILHDPARFLPYLASFFERLRTTNNLLRMEIRRRGGHAAAAERLHIEPQPAGPPLRVLPSARVVFSAESPDVRKRCSVEELRVDKFPFRIGRMSGAGGADVLAHNDYFIRDDEPFQVSRNHCAIDREGERFCVRDRGSDLGTIVNGRTVGLKCESLSAMLDPGDNRIVLGGAKSPYVFIARVCTGPAS